MSPQRLREVVEKEGGGALGHRDMQALLLEVLGCLKREGARAPLGQALPRMACGRRPNSSV